MNLRDNARVDDLRVKLSSCIPGEDYVLALTEAGEVRLDLAFRVDPQVIEGRRGMVYVERLPGARVGHVPARDTDWVRGLFERLVRAWTTRATDGAARATECTRR